MQTNGVRGTAPPLSTKVAITGVGGWHNSSIFALTGVDLDATAALVERSVRRHIEQVDGIDSVAIERIGRAQDDPDSQNAGTELLKISAQGTQQPVFSSRLVELALSSYPGCTPSALLDASFGFKGVDADPTSSGLVQGFGSERDLAVGVVRVRVSRAHSPWSDHARSARKARSASRVSAS